LAQSALFTPRAMFSKSQKTAMFLASTWLDMCAAFQMSHGFGPQAAFTSSGHPQWPHSTTADAGYKPYSSQSYPEARHCVVDFVRVLGTIQRVDRSLIL
jgi:hypothetical protein